MLQRQNCVAATMWNYVKLFCCIWFAELLAYSAQLQDVIVEPEEHAETYVDTDYATYRHTTCEFDLASRFWATQPQNNYRPFPSQLFKDKCETMYRFPERNKVEREKLFEEASAFGQWLSKLQDYEVKQSKRPLCDGGVYHEDTHLRQQMYARTKIWECYKLTDNILFLSCLITRRKKMIAMIPKE